MPFDQNLNVDSIAVGPKGSAIEPARKERHVSAYAIMKPEQRAAQRSVPDSGYVDEYASGDPYRVEENLTSEFQERRIESTLRLLRSVWDDGLATPNMLDIGCGQGHITERIRTQFPGAQILAFDYSKTAIRHAAKSFSKIHFCVADAYEPPCRTHSVDFVICNNLWEHVPNPLSLLDAVRQSLKPGGYLIVSTPSRYRFSNLLSVLRGKEVAHMSPHHVTEYSVGQVKEQLRWRGFEVNEIYSHPLNNRPQGVKGFVAYRLLLPMLRYCLRRVGSHHHLESTVFFLARKS